METPISYTIDFGFGFTQIDTVTYAFTFDYDPLDPGECIYIENLKMSPFCNTGDTPQTFRELISPYAPDIERFKDGAESGQLCGDPLCSGSRIGNPSYAIRITSLVITVTGEAIGQFSVEGTLWRACAAMRSNLNGPPYLSINCDTELGFYQGNVFGDFGVQSPVDPRYYDLGVVSIAFSWPDRNFLYNFFLAIMQPTTGLGVLIWRENYTGCARCAPHDFNAIGIMFKIKDYWTPQHGFE
jgi:hypothetical protein